MSLRARRLPLAGAALAAVALGGAAAAPPVPTTPAQVTPYASTSREATYETYDAFGRVDGTARWRWTSTGGNCCEAYVTTSGGRLLEFGGTQPFLTDDRGSTWQRVDYATPGINGEGALVGGPGRDVFGIGWDPYAGDRLQAVRYTAATRTWEVAEAPLRTPFFDREWITYAKGPFVVGGEQRPFVTVVRGGGLTRSVELISGDGLSYTTLSSPQLDARAAPVPMTIPVVPNPAADDWQPNPGAYTVPLTGGGLLLLNNGEDDLPCPAARLNASTTRWECVSLPFTPQGILRQDSRGWLTQVRQTGARTVRLSTSPDGGRTWEHLTLTAPAGTALPAGGRFVDVKANGRLGQAVVASRAREVVGGHGKDLVWRVDISDRRPRLLETYGVGAGDLDTEVGITPAGTIKDQPRYDFPSVALLPDGRIAASYFDRTVTDGPGVAILDGTR